MEATWKFSIARTCECDYEWLFAFLSTVSCWLQPEVLLAWTTSFVNSPIWICCAAILHPDSVGWMESLQVHVCCCWKKKKVFSTASWNCLRHDDVAALHTWWCHSPLFLTTNELPLVAFRQIWSSLSNGRLEKTQGCTKRQWFAFWGGGFRGGQVWGNEMPPCVAANIGHARNRHQLLVLLFLSKSIFFNTALCFTLLFLVVMCFRWAQTVKSHFQAFCVEWPVLWNIFSHWLTVLWFWKAK